jgi:hypothetical protein
MMTDRSSAETRGTRTSTVEDLTVALAEQVMAWRALPERFLMDRRRYQMVTHPGTLPISCESGSSSVVPCGLEHFPIQIEGQLVRHNHAGLAMRSPAQDGISSRACLCAGRIALANALQILYKK